LIQHFCNDNNNDALRFQPRGIFCPEQLPWKQDRGHPDQEPWSYKNGIADNGVQGVGGFFLAGGFAAGGGSFFVGGMLLPSSSERSETRELSEREYWNLMGLAMVSG